MDPVVKEALEMGCTVRFRTDSGQTIEIEPEAIPGHLMYNPMSGQFEEDGTAFDFSELNTSDDSEEETDLEDEAPDWNMWWEDQPHNASLYAELDGCAVEADGEGKNRMVITLNLEHARTVVPQLLGVAEAILDRAHHTGLCPVDFEDLLRQMVNDFDRADAEEALR